MALPAPPEVEIHYLDEHGGWVCASRCWMSVPVRVVLGRPVRSFATYKNQPTYPRGGCVKGQEILPTGGQ